MGAVNSNKKKEYTEIVDEASLTTFLVWLLLLFIVYCVYGYVEHGTITQANNDSWM